MERFDVNIPQSEVSGFKLQSFASQLVSHVWVSLSSCSSSLGCLESCPEWHLSLSQSLSANGLARTLSWSHHSGDYHPWLPRYTSSGLHHRPEEVYLVPHLSALLHHARKRPSQRYETGPDARGQWVLNVLPAHPTSARSQDRALKTSCAH